MNTNEKPTFNAPDIESEQVNELSIKLFQAKEELARANEQLKYIQKQREEMLSNISHDLRAPLTAIRSALDAMLESKNLTPEETREFLGTIDRRARTLEDMVNDMYYLFCVEDTGKKLDFTEIDALPFFEEYFFDATTDARYDDRDMQLDIPEDLEAVINIDVQKIIRVMDNLFTNAAKYSESGDFIRLSVHKDSASDSLTIEVADSGIGIPPEALPNVFNRTYTVSSARTPNGKTGSGLGLSIAKAVVERHGGSIFVNSALGVGSTFIIKLPIVK